MKSNILVIENNFAERARILRILKEYKLKQTIHFVSDVLEALTELYFFNKSQPILNPQIILLNYHIENFDFLKKLKSDTRYRNIKIYVLADKEYSFYKEKLKDFKITGVVNRLLDFKKNTDDSFPDTNDLYQHLLKSSSSKKQYINKQN
jgi:hypothetical protein